MNLQESIRKDLDRLNEAPLELTSDPMYDYIEVGKRLEKASGILINGVEFWKIWYVAVHPVDIDEYVHHLDLDENINEPFVWVQRGIESLEDDMNQRAIWIKNIIKAEAGPRFPKYILVKLQDV